MSMNYSSSNECVRLLFKQILYRIIFSKSKLKCGEDRMAKPLPSGCGLMGC